MTEPTKAAARARRIAGDFKSDDRYEHLAQFAANGEQLAPSQLIPLGLYREQQATARAHGRNV